MMTVQTMLRYLARPRFVDQRFPVDADGLRHLTGVLMLTLLFGIILSAVLGGIVQGAMGELPENVNGTLAETDPAQLLFYGVVLAPIFEELIFRSWLGLPRSSLLGLPALLCVIAIIVAAMTVGDTIVSFIIAFGLAALYFMLVRRARSVEPETHDAARARLFPLIFWGSTLTFALVHITNFEGGMGAALAAPILFLAVIPQLMAGAVFGYVRMLFGLFPAIVFHSLYNLVLIGIAVFAITLSDMPSASDAATSLSALLR